MTQTTQSFKLIYQGNYYRRSFSSVTYQQIRDEITNTITHTHLFYLQYFDNEGDLISLSSDMELEELAQLSQELPIKIIIKEGSFQLEATSSQTDSIPLCNSPQQPPTEKEIDEMNKFLEEQGYHKTTADVFPDESPVDHNINCKQCSKKIIGTRWLCSVCPAFDLCQSCESLHDKAHPLVRIIEPISRSSEAVFSLCSNLQQSKERISFFNSYASEIARSFKTDITTFVSGARNHTAGVAANLMEKAQKLPTTLHLVKAKEPPKDFYSMQKEKFDMLEEFGFCDRVRNEEILVRFDGDINACLDHLLAIDKLEVD